jgi:hypothetical protein
VARFSLSTSHQGVLPVEGLRLNFSCLSIAGHDSRGVIGRIDGDDFRVGNESCKNGLIGIHGIILRRTPRPR